MSGKPKKLNFPQRLAYGSGELGPAIAGSTLVFFQLVFLTDVAGLEPALAGSVLLIARVWDAINDPLIGHLSDHTKSKFGRRLPWMMAGALPFALLFSVFWLGPWIVGEGAGQWTKFGFYSFVAVLYSTATTSLALTHSSLTAELSHDYDERSRLTAARMGFSLAGSVGGLILALVVFTLLPDASDAVKYGIFGACVAGIGLLAVITCIVGIWKVTIATEQERLRNPAHIPAPKSTKGLSGWKTVVGNRPFLIVCGIYLCSWLAMQFTAGVLPYYTKTVMDLSQTTFQTLALTVQATALVLIPVWEQISIRWGKKQVYFAGMAFWIAAQAGLLFLPTGNLPLLYVMGFIAGFGISVCYLIPNAMLPDVIEWDELRTGKRREGVYYGFCVFLQKVAFALGTFVIGIILSLAGYQSGAEEGFQQPDSALLAIRIAIGPIPALVLIVGLVFAAFYPLDRERHGKLVRILERKRNRRLPPHPQ